MGTYFAKPSEITRRWYLVDANGKPLGRLAARVAAMLRGKHKPTFTPHMDTGDHVIVINAEKITLSGNKLRTKMYTKHTGYPGGLKSVTAEHVLQKRPTQLVERAIKGMLPKTPLGKQMARKLKVYAGSEHPHQSQQPEPIAL
jgi:large subunit ribosomal protein L13